MASKFECEVRFVIKDIKAHKKRLKELGGRPHPYEFNDYYYRPMCGTWDSLKKTLRIRHFISPRHPTRIYFAKNEVVSFGGMRFKRALYPQGKVPLFEGDLRTCQALLRDLGFKEWFVLKKKRSHFWSLSGQGFDTVTEYIDGLGWSGELEFSGENPGSARKKFEHALTVLKIPRTLVSFKPISVIVAEARGIL